MLAWIGREAQLRKVPVRRVPEARRQDGRAPRGQGRREVELGGRRTGGRLVAEGGGGASSAGADSVYHYAFAIDTAFVKLDPWCCPALFPETTSDSKTFGHQEIWEPNGANV